MALTPRQERFIAEILKDPNLNATAAYIRAGYKAKGHAAESAANRLLKNVEVKARIEAVKAKRAERTQVDVDRVVTELAKVGFANMRRYATFGESGIKLVDSDNLTDDDMACISELSETRTAHGGSTRFKLHDKLTALNMLGKHLGMFPDKVALSADAELMEILKGLTDAELKAVAGDAAEQSPGPATGPGSAASKPVEPPGTPVGS